MPDKTPSPDTGLSGVKHMIGTPEFQAGYKAGMESEYFLKAEMPDISTLTIPYDDPIQRERWIAGFRAAVL